MGTSVSDEQKDFDRKKPWWANIGCLMRLQLESHNGAVTGKLVRIDVNEFRKYAVIDQDGAQISVNIDHILYAKEI
jgi:hypothetical protein